MENRAHYIFIGAAVLAFIAALAVFVVWKIGSRGEGDVALYRVYFDGDVQGLAVDSPVFYRGIRVGRVTGIRIGDLPRPQPDGSTRKVERVVVNLAVSYRLDIRENAYALFEKPLIAGQSYIQIVGGPDTDPVKPKKRRNERPYPEIAQGSTLLQSAVTSAQDVLNKIDKMLSEKNLKEIETFLVNIAKVSKAIGDQDAQIAEAIKQLPQTLAEIGNLSKSLQLIALELGPQDTDTKARLAGRQPGELKAALDNINKVSAQLGRILGDTRTPLKQFSETGLNEFTQMVRELKALVASLNVITTRIERDPTGFVFGGKQGYQPK